MAAPVPVVSVIVAARDMERFIGATLRSLSRQSLADLEAVIVDDGSTDRTAAIVRAHLARDGRMRLIRGKAAGVSAARNRGLSESRGDMVLFVDADDLLAPDALARLVARLKAGDAPAVLGGVARMAEDGTRIDGPDNRALVPAADHLTGLLRKNFVVNGGALLIRRAAIAAAGGYDPDLGFGEDWEFWCRLAAQGDFALLEGAPVLSYRQRAQGANVIRRGGAFARRLACIEAVRANPVLRARLGRQLGRHLRARRIDIFWTGVRAEFEHGSRARALLRGLGGLVVYPDSLLHPRLALRFVSSLRA
ncbi:glycosyltransferase family 2 protein [Halovulum dunhuangense]|uniref:Glycosyltransferase family 2 protein n=1 Tax=Halovulum dunhuangense TaxID=1505036 RepID=A0A849L1V5_9RHOB|nr:glycosyltransferase family 2 protein [Halovulum dunhuangense]NNU80298.1 glycosyltransferase family 2 protein [Halovulum dunhuangense]